MLDFETEYIESARPFQRIVNSYRNVVLTNKGNIALFVVTYLHTYRYEHERDKFKTTKFTTEHSVGRNQHSKITMLHQHWRNVAMMQP